MSGETTVGSIVGFMRMEAGEFHREMEKAIAEVDHLDGKNVNIDVKADTARAEAGLARVSAESDKVNKSSKDAGQGMGALVAAIVAVGPAVVPISVATVGLAAGFGAMGAAGIAALIGIRHEMQAGSSTGLAYSSGIKTLTGDMNTLGTIAAKGVLAPFQSVVRDLQSKMPVLSGMIRDFSSVTGKTAANLTSGLVAAFVTLEPLMRDVGTYVFGLSQQFQAMMTGPGVKSFGDYVRSVFPQVMATVESLVGAAIRLVAAFAPLGLGVLSEIKALSDLINAIPVNVLAELATLATSAFLGFKSFSLIKGMVEGLGSGLRSLGLSAEAAATGMEMATVAAGVIGAAVAVVTFLVSANAEANRANQQAVNDYTDALRQSNGVIDQSIRAKTAQMLADNGTLQLARDLHVSLMDVTSAAMGQKDAIAWVNAELNKQRDAMRGQVNASGSAGQAYDVFNGKAADLRKQIGMNNTDFQKALQNFKDQKAATQQSAAATDAQTAALQNLSAATGLSADSLTKATAAQQQQKQSAADAAAQMFIENDAAGILKTSLDALNGKALSAADAQNAFDSSLANMGTHVNATGKMIIFTTTSIHDMSAASVALRGQLNGQVKNLEAVVEANGGLSNSTGKARAQMVTMRQQIIDNAVAHGVDRKAVTDYIDKLLAIPKKIPPTKLDVDTAAALVKLKVMQTAINSLTGKAVSIYTDNYITTHAGAVGNAAATANRYAQGNAYSTTAPPVTGSKPVARATGGDIPGYAGGTLIGPGSGTSDSILAMVAQTRQLVRLSTGEFISTDASRRRNRAALEAGNRGAQLEVAGKGEGIDYNRLAAAVARAMSGVTLRPTIAVGSVDRAMGGSLR